MRDTLRWLDRCQDTCRIHPILTPRFTPSCTDKLMEFLGRLAAERGLPVQSHLSENRAEIQWVRELHPDCEQYWETYAKYDLWNDRTLMAHCVWSDEWERQAMKNAGVTVVHCPDSNLNLCSGTAPVRTMLTGGVRVALGSDIAGGDHLDMFDVTAAAILQDPPHDGPGSPGAADSGGGVVSGHLRRGGVVRGTAGLRPRQRPARHGPLRQRTASWKVPDPGPTAGAGGIPAAAECAPGGVFRWEESI